MGEGGRGGWGRGANDVKMAPGPRTRGLLSRPLVFPGLRRQRRQGPSVTRFAFHRESCVLRAERGRPGLQPPPAAGAGQAPPPYHPSGGLGAPAPPDMRLQRRTAHVQSWRGRRPGRIPACTAARCRPPGELTRAHARAQLVSHRAGIHGPRHSVYPLYAYGIRDGNF